jgi:molybdopterin converting factor small subunit
LRTTVNLSGRFRDLFDAPDELGMDLSDGATIRDLLSRLCESRGRRPEIFYSSAGLKPNVTVTVNGRFIIHLNWLDTVLSEGDRVKVFTLHCGG